MATTITPKRKAEFAGRLKEFTQTLSDHISAEDGQWTVKGFIDVFQNVYTISADTKIVSKILEIHLFPKIVEFAQRYGYKLVLAEHQNYYPDISLVSVQDEAIKFALDFKTTYRLLDKPHLCNGFTLGSHGRYFEDRRSHKNIQFPYGSYAGHFCLGIIYSRAEGTAVDETRIHRLTELQSIASVIQDFQFFAVEKWRIASDKSGSGNTANIGSVNNIEDIVNGNGMFARLGEEWFDDYWMNYRKISIPDGRGGIKKIANLHDFVLYRRGDPSLIVPQRMGAA
jgi:hypothetical protein